MKKAYLIKLKKTQVAEIWVLAESEKAALKMVDEDPQCIDYNDWDEFCGDATCEDECDIEELDTSDSVYNEAFYKMHKDELIAMITEGGEE